MTKNSSLRCTLVKHTVGTVRRTTYDLPDTEDNSHVYGYRLPRDPEGAGDMIRNWAQGRQCKDLSNSSDISEDLIVNDAASTPRNRKTPRVDMDIIHGVKTIPSEDIRGLIQARYTSFSNDSSNYADLSRMNVKGQLPREARDCVLKDIRKLAMPMKERASPKKLFKMTKFKNVAPVLHTQPTRMT